MLTRVIGDQLELAAFTSSDPSGDEALKAGFPFAVETTGSFHGLAIHRRAPFACADVAKDRTQSNLGHRPVATRGVRALLGS